MPAQSPAATAAPTAPNTSVDDSADRAPASARVETDRLAAIDSQVDAKLAEYRIALGLQAGRFKRYPPLARERGWEGTVRIEIRIHPQQALPEVLVLRESGHGILDEAAFEMMRQAVARTAIPDVLRQRGVQLIVPVEFGLASLDE